MVRQPAQDRYTLPTRKDRILNTKKKQLTIFLTSIMLASLFAPSLSTDVSFLEPSETRHETANNTLNDSATQTIMSNLNTSNPVEITGVMGRERLSAVTTIRTNFDQWRRHRIDFQYSHWGQQFNINL